MSIHTISKDQIFALTDFETTGLADKRSVPIEVGIIFVDKNMKIITQYSSLINWWGKYDARKKYEWNRFEIDASKVHGITKTDVIKNGKDPETVCDEIEKIIAKINKSENKPIIISDNSFFEVHFMQILFEMYIDETPFHYNAWSVLPFVSYCGAKMLKTHRAIEDCNQMYDALLQSYFHFDLFDKE